MAISGRFEWVSIPQRDNVPENYEVAATAFEARACPGCGWIDGARRFETLSGEAGTRECWRCGMRWDLSVEINSFFVYFSRNLSFFKNLLKKGAYFMSLIKSLGEK